MNALQKDASSRRSNRASGTSDIRNLRSVFKVEELTKFQFRINGVLDLYPTSRKFHNLISGKRGDYTATGEALTGFVFSQIGAKKISTKVMSWEELAQ